MTHATARNRLLDKLDRRDLEKISPDLEPVELPLRKVLQEPNSTIRFVYFVTKGVISMVGEPGTGEVVEFAIPLRWLGKCDYAKIRCETRAIGEGSTTRFDYTRTFEIHFSSA